MGMGRKSGWASQNRRKTVAKQTMQVLVVQPPNPAPVLPVGPRVPAYIPHHALLNLSCYLQHRSRHQCRVVDANQLGDPLAEAAEAIAATPPPRVLLVHAPVDRVVETARLLAACGGPAAAIKIALFGPLPTHFPGIARALAPYAYLVRGDPEAPLKSLIDYVDLPQRLEKIPGLVTPGSDRFPEPLWLDELGGLGFDALQTVSWLAVPRERGEIPNEATLRLTRGNSGLPPDRDFDGAGQPLRWLNPREMAVALAKCSNWGVARVHLEDPPGVWSPERLDEWLDVLDTLRNTMPWSLRLLPTMLSADTMRRLSQTGCEQVRFLIPSVRPEILGEYGCVLGWKPFGHTLRQLRHHGVDTRLDFWIGGPGEPPSEEEHVHAVLRRLLYPEFTLSAFPRRLDAPRTWEESPDTVAAEVGAELRRAASPDTPGSAPAIMGGAGAAAERRLTAARLEHKLRRSVIWTVKNNWEDWNPAAWIRRIENMVSEPR